MRVHLAFRPELLSLHARAPGNRVGVPRGNAAISLSTFAVNAALGVNTIQELVDLIKRSPGKYAFGSIGAGSLSHLAMEAIALKSLSLIHI